MDSDQLASQKPDQLASQKPADLDQHCYQNSMYPVSAWWGLRKQLAQIHVYINRVLLERVSCLSGTKLVSIPPVRPCSCRHATDVAEDANGV